MDCMEYMATLPDNSVDIVVTSPPYNQLHQTGGGFMANGKFADTCANGYKSHSDDMAEGDYQAWMNAMLQECLRIAKGLVWINHKVRYRNKKGIHPLQFFNAPFYSEVIWDRGSSMTLNARKYAPSHEVVYGFGVPHFWDRKHDTLMSVWRIPPRPQGLDHPCPFPVALAERLIASSCPPGGTVYDPFSGAATTGIAAMNAGCSFIGTEIDPDYIEVARKRLDAHMAQPGLFTEQLKLA